MGIRKCTHHPDRRYVRNEPCAVRGPSKFVQSVHCLDCDATMSIGPSSPPPRYEFSLAIVLADIHRLWPNAEQKCDEAVEIWAQQFEVAE